MGSVLYYFDISVLVLFQDAVQQCTYNDTYARSHRQWETAKPWPHWPDPVSTLLQAIWHALWDADSHWKGNILNWRHIAIHKSVLSMLLTLKR